MRSIRGFWRHVENGSVYVVESTTLGEVVAGDGPVDGGNLKPLDEYRCTPRIQPWLVKAIAEKKLRRVNLQSGMYLVS